MAGSPNRIGKDCGSNIFKQENLPPLHPKRQGKNICIVIMKTGDGTLFHFANSDDEFFKISLANYMSNLIHLSVAPTGMFIRINRMLWTRFLMHNTYEQDNVAFISW